MSHFSMQVGGVVMSPLITSLSPNSGTPGDSVTITGTSFGSAQGASTVTFNGVTATVQSWSNTSIVVTVPQTTTGPVIVTANGRLSNAMTFNVPPILSWNGTTAGTQVISSGVIVQFAPGSYNVWVNIPITFTFRGAAGGGGGGGTDRSYSQFSTPQSGGCGGGSAATTQGITLNLVQGVNYQLVVGAKGAGGPGYDGNPPVDKHGQGSPGTQTYFYNPNVGYLSQLSPGGGGDNGFIGTLNTGGGSAGVVQAGTGVNGVVGGHRSQQFTVGLPGNDNPSGAASGASGGYPLGSGNTAPDGGGRGGNGMATGGIAGVPGDNSSGVAQPGGDAGLGKGGQAHGVHGGGGGGAGGGATFAGVSGQYGGGGGGAGGVIDTDPGGGLGMNGGVGQDGTGILYA